MKDKQKIVQLTYMQLLTDLGPALNEFKSIKMNGSLVLKVVKSLNNVVDMLGVYDELRRKVLDSFIEKAENGSPVTEVVDGQMVYKFKSPEDKAEAEKAVSELSMEEITIVLYPISEDEVASIPEVSASAVGALSKWGFII